MDFYNIPGDTGGDWRLNKFIEYQHFAPAIDPITNSLYAQKHRFSESECILLAWYHSSTYCEITAIWLTQAFDFYNPSPEYLINFWNKYKSVMRFGSARRYAKNMDWFPCLIEQFQDKTYKEPDSWLYRIAGTGSPKEHYRHIENELKSWKYMGRFSIDLFLEALIAFSKIGLMELSLEIPEYDWKNCSNLTSGLLNIMYKDEEANEFDRTGKLDISQDKLDKLVYKIYAEVQKMYPNQGIDIVSVVNKICSFRNLFKGTRYGGFHSDRQLENLKAYQKSLPEFGYIWDEIFGIRKESFPKHMLGELNDWNGIRKERKKLWLERGLTGVEIGS
jgi:hypothetical protein